MNPGQHSKSGWSQVAGSHLGKRAERAGVQDGAAALAGPGFRSKQPSSSSD